MNLNTIEPQTDGREAPKRVRSASGVRIIVHFDGIERAIIDLIRSHDVVLGCVAWLTSKPILEACIGKDAVFIVQKEDFLRPDGASNAELRRLYDSIGKRDGAPRFQYPGLVSELSTLGGYGFNGVRCVGNHNRDKSPAWPRMHHKFAVFGRWADPFPEDDDTGLDRLDLTCVWTGSFNFTRNAGLSLENGLVIEDEAIVKAYYDEFAHVAALSEPLNWSDNWCAPEWRIGT